MPEPIDIEVNISKEDSSLYALVEKLGTPSIYACPECHGVLLQLQENGRLRFRCHTGHAYSVQSLLADMDKGVEGNLWAAVRAFQEKLLLSHHLAGMRGKRAMQRQPMDGCDSPRMSSVAPPWCVRW